MTRLLDYSKSYSKHDREVPSIMTIQCYHSCMVLLPCSKSHTESGLIQSMVDTLSCLPFPFTPYD
jgi:hypothetical protein